MLPENTADEALKYTVPGNDVVGDTSAAVSRPQSFPEGTSLKLALAGSLSLAAMSDRTAGSLRQRRRDADHAVNSGLTSQA